MHRFLTGLFTLGVGCGTIALMVAITAV